MFYPNKTVTITRGNSFATSVVTGLRVYIYELSDDLSAINNVEWGQDELKMLSRYADIQIGDKIVDQDSLVYIVKSAKERKSVFSKHYEYIVRKKYD